MSFPSDHALTIGGIAVGLWLVDRTLAKVAAALAILMAFTPPTSGFTTRRTWWPDWRIAGLVAAIGSKPGSRLLAKILVRLERVVPGVHLLTGRPSPSPGFSGRRW